MMMMMMVMTSFLWRAPPNKKQAKWIRSHVFERRSREKFFFLTYDLTKTENTPFNRNKWTSSDFIFNTYWIADEWAEWWCLSVWIAWRILKMHRVWTSCTVCSHWLLLGGERPGHNTKRIFSLKAPLLSRQRISLFVHGQCRQILRSLKFSINFWGQTFFPQKSLRNRTKNRVDWCGNWHGKQSIGHFRVPKTLSLKTRLSANPFLWKWVLFPWKLKLIFTSMVLYLASLWNRGPGELGNGQSLSLTRSCDLSCAAFKKFCSSSTNCWGTVPIRPSSWACESFWASFSGRPRKRWRSTTWASYQNNKQ